MPKRRKKLVTLSRNSYIGRIKGVHPAFLPNRCKDLTDEERFLIEGLEQAVKNLLTIMENKHVK